MIVAFAAPLPLFLLALSTHAQESNERARKLFVTNCASCHGETGDGKGTTQLDRPARSFMDGGFSFGNTPEALFRTISVGIPGSPMAGFDASLSEEERKLLADYVVTLGPPIEEVKDEDMILPVHDRPRIVRGLLPSLGEGLPTHPRGLLIGDPSGITFEYAVDDVRLLALRQGGFVKRTDWTGRGGTALEPLGKVVHLVQAGKPAASFYVGDVALDARFSGTRLAGVEATLDYHLADAKGEERAHVIERPQVLTTPYGTGFVRRLELVATSAPVALDVRTNPLAAPGAMTLLDLPSGAIGCVVTGPDGQHLCFVARADRKPDDAYASTNGETGLVLTLPPGSRTHVELTTLVLTGWTEKTASKLARMLAR